MAAVTNEYARQYQGESMDEGHPESKFSHSPWEKSEHRELNQASVTMWVGVASIIVAIPIQDIDPEIWTHPLSGLV